MDRPNRRQAPRFSVSQLLELSFGKERWVHATGVDISATGFRAIVDESIDTGASMFVMFRIDDETIRVEAIAIHVSPITATEEQYQVGFQFIDVDSTTRALLKRYVASLDTT